MYIVYHVTHFEVSWNVILHTRYVSTYCSYAYHFFTRIGCTLLTCDMYMSDLRHIHDPVISSLKMEGIRLLFFLWRCDPTRVTASSFLRFLDHTRLITVGRTPLDEWSARSRDLYLRTHNTHNRQISMSPVGFEPTISAGERPQTYALDRAANGTDRHIIHLRPKYSRQTPSAYVSPSMAGLLLHTCYIIWLDIACTLWLVWSNLTWICLTRGYYI
jgi:hypothetical protein